MDAAKSVKLPGVGDRKRRLMGGWEDGWVVGQMRWKEIGLKGVHQNTHYSFSVFVLQLTLIFSHF